MKESKISQTGAMASAAPRCKRNAHHRILLVKEDRYTHRRILRFMPVILATLLMTCQLQAQVNWLTDNRFVTASGHGQIPTEVSSNYFATATPATSFGSFNKKVSGTCDVYGTVLMDGDTYSAQCGGSSSATQNSFLTGNQFNFSSYVWAGTGGLPGGGVESPQLLPYGEGDSFCEMTFSVNSPQTWSLAGDLVDPYGNASVNWNLISAQAGSILGAPCQNPDPNSPSIYYQGSLTPGDTYTLTFSLNASRNMPDPLGDSSSAGVEAIFSVVPEPSSYALMVLGLTSLFALAKKAVKAHSIC
jgi:hypothetical protein